MATSRDDIRRRVDAFVDELTELVRRAALEAVEEALAGASGGRRGRGTRVAAAGTTRRGRARGKGERRSPKALAATAARLASHVAANPGQRIEEIGKALGTPTRELALPVQKLLKAGEIKRKGERRATRYFPGSKRK